MRTVKRLLCMALVITMVMSCSSIVMADEDSTSGSFSDVANDQIYSNAVSTLNLMGVINGYPDGTFGPDKNVTRAEFTAMLMRTLNLGNVGSSSAAELPFTDVDDNNSDINWAIPNINTAYGMKIINGYEDATFRPSANVSYEEAVKMLVCTLGYGDNVDVSSNPWYANFIAIGNQIGITRTASKVGQVETPATRSCIAQLLYDSLEVRLVKNGSKTDETILNSYLGYEKNIGIIVSNGITGIMSATVNDKDNEVQIYVEDEDSLYTYKTNDDSLKNYLGHEIEFYYKENDTNARVLVLYVLHSAEPVVINAANIEKRNTNAGTIAYYENLNDENEVKLSLESDNVVIYNGKLYGADADDSRFDKSMIPTLGQLKLTDSDGNKKYDIVEITSYEVYYVSNKDTAKKGIIDNLIAPADKKTVTLDIDADKNLYIVDENGKEISYSSISTGNIICLAKSRSENGSAVITTAVVLNDKVTGTVTASKNGVVTIAGKEYSYSNAAPWLNGGALAEPQVQDSGTYFLDINGDIVAYNKNAVTENIKYGYIIGYYEDLESMEEEVEFRVLTTTGTTEYLGTYKNTTINGEPYPTGVAVANKLKNTATNGHTGRFAVQQLVKYTTRKNDGKDVFEKIVTATGVDQGQDITTESLTALKSFYKDSSNAENMSTPKTATYNSNSKTLITVEEGENPSTKVSVGNAVVISVPEDREDYDEFRKSSISTSLKNGVNYTVEVFDLSKSNVPKVVVVYGADNSQAVNTLSPVYVVNSIGEELNNGESMYRAEVYKTTNLSGSIGKEWISNDSTAPDELEPGDIFRAGIDKDGNSIAKDEYMILDMSESVTFGTVVKDTQAGITDIEEAEFVTIIGSVVARDDETLLVADRKFSEQDVKDQSYLTTDAMSFDIEQFGDAIVLIYDTEGAELELISGNYVDTIAGFTSYTDEVAPTKILIYMSEGEIKLLCVLPEEF